MKHTIKGLQAILVLALVVLGIGCVHPGDLASSLEGVSIRRAPVTPLLQCQSDAFRIDLLGAVEAIPDDTLDAQREQLRDWIWMTTLGRIAPRTSVDDVFSGVMDQPLVRDDSLAHVLRLPVGPTRAVTTKKGEIIVLVEAASEAAMASEVLEAIDEEALSLGHTPEQVQIYGYELRPSVAEASVCKIGGLDRGALESAAQGYRSALITSAPALDQFLSGGVDLLSAQCTPLGLQVAGRQRPRTTRANVTVEHVAALAQELGAHYLPAARFGVTLDTLPKEERADIEDRAQNIDRLLAASVAKQVTKQKEYRDFLAARTEEERQFIRTVFAWKEENPAVPTTEILLSYLLQSRFDGKPGFSLDPVITVASATKGLDAILAALQSSRSALASLLRAWGDDATARYVLAAKLDRSEVQETALKLSEVGSRLQRARDEDVRGILLHRESNPSPGVELANELLFSLWSRSGQQCARYDGPLAGTATGMTFFYTDLLAKLTTFDWRGVAQGANVEGFESVVTHAGSTAWCEEEERPSTRLWFGVRDEAYARERAGGVRFAPTAARIFALGSVPGSGEGEVEANAQSRRFIAWWDKHFARIAEWEPQYEALNQLMKWSVVTQSARIAGDPSCLRFLRQAPVKSDQRFDRWIAETPNLQWRGPISFVAAPQKATECLPLLTSAVFGECGGQSSLTGGVGAATLKQVQAKVVRSVETPVGLGRLGAESKPVSVGPNRVQFAELSGAGGKLRAVEIEGNGARVTFKADIDTAASQRGSLSSSDPGNPVTTTAKTVESSGNGIALQQRSNGLRSAGLKASDLDRAAVHLEVTRGDMEEAKACGAKLAEHIALEGGSLPSAARSLALNHEVQILDDGNVAVRLGADEGKKTWAIMSSGGGNRGPPGAEAGLVVGVPEGGPYDPALGGARLSKPVNVWVVSDQAAESYLAAQGSKPSLGSSETSAAVKSKLESGDHAGAMQAFADYPTGPAAKLIVDAAVARGDVGSVGLVVDTLIKRGSSEDLGELIQGLNKRNVLVERSGGDPSVIARHVVRLSIERRIRLVPGANEASTVRELGSRLPTYGSEAYSPQGGQPSPVYPRGTPLPPGEHQVSRIIDIQADLELPSTLKTADGIALTLHPASGETAADLRRATNTVGSAMRLLVPLRRIVIVRGCSDTDETQPPCHEPPLGEHRNKFEALKRQICDHNNDGALSSPAERGCLVEMGTCDLDGDGTWLAPADEECLIKLYRKSR